jgi:flavin reductase (DIM6/NTAB) family NADH-FMN oxidoreductase RutF
VSEHLLCDDRGVDREEFADLVDGLDYPMFVVTTVHEGERAGCMVGFTTQASIDPPRMLVCLSVKNRTHRVALGADVLAVHVLDPDDGPLAELFGGETGDDVDKFARVDWSPGAGGVPLLHECSRRFVGRVLDRFELGDHTGFLLDPIEATSEGDGPALGFQQVDDLEPGHEA